MATLYQINIAMSPDTVEALKVGGDSLYGFKAVAAAAPSGAPVVWFADQTYLEATRVGWATEYQAYTSSLQILPDEKISMGFRNDIDLDQTLEVTSPSGSGEVIFGGSPSAISIHNQTAMQFSCGIAEQIGGVWSPTCVFLLVAMGTDVIAPVEKVLLMFSADQIDAGTVIERAPSQGFLVDLSGAPGNARDVTFDMRLGWDCGGCDWAEVVPPDADLSPLLIEKYASASGSRDLDDRD